MHILFYNKKSHHKFAKKESHIFIPAKRIYLFLVIVLSLKKFIHFSVFKKCVSIYSPNVIVLTIMLTASSFTEAIRRKACFCFHSVPIVRIIYWWKIVGIFGGQNTKNVQWLVLFAADVMWCVFVMCAIDMGIHQVNLIGVIICLYWVFMWKAFQKQ